VNPALNYLFGGNNLTLGDVGGSAGLFAAGKDNGLFGSIIGGVADLFGARAFGGPVGAGQPYLVGERGPELFVPQVAGRIQSNAASPVSIVMNISTPDAASFRASQSQIAAQMLDGVRRAQRIR
jgi:phage-related minor tail protein